MSEVVTGIGANLEIFTGGGVIGESHVKMELDSPVCRIRIMRRIFYFCI